MILPSFLHKFCNVRRINCLIRIIALIVGCSLLGSCATLRNSEVETIGDSDVIYAALGSGPITIVLEAGLGDGMESWDNIFADISSISEVFAYSRPGYGLSGTTSRPRNMRQIVTDLRQLLRSTGNNPPYILVGHSLGGDYMLYYAEQYPLEVAGLVLIEARHPEFSRLCRDNNLTRCDVPSVVYSLWPEHTRREYDAAKHMPLSAKISNIPLAVISRTPNKGVIESKAFKKLWMDTQKAFVKLSPNSKLFVAKNAGHYVHKDEPSTVMNGIRWVLSQWEKMRK